MLFNTQSNTKKYNNKVKSILEKKLAIQEIKTSAIELETGSRGFVITGEEQYLEHYNSSISTINNDFNYLKSVEADNDSMNNKLNELENLIQKKITHIQKTIELRRNEGIEAAMAHIQTGEGKKLTDEIIFLDDDLMQQQNSQLKNKKDQQQKLFSQYQTFLVLFISILIVSLVSVYFIIRNILMRLRNSTDELLRTANFLSSVLENIPHMVFIKETRELRFIEFNKAGEKLLGYSRDALIGKNDYDFFSKEQADLFTEKDRETLSSNEIIEIEEQIDTVTGKRWLHTKKISLTDEQGRPAYLLGISEDITEQKIKDEKEKQQAREIYELFNNAPCGYFTTNKEGFITKINDTLLNWLKYKSDEVVNRKHAREFITEDSTEIFNFFYTRFRTGELKSIRDFEIRFKRKDGSSFPVQISGQPEFDKDGNYFRTKLTVVDITEQKKDKMTIIKN